MEAVVLVVLQRRSGQRAVVLVVLWSMEEGWRTFALFKLYSNFQFCFHYTSWLYFMLCFWVFCTQNYFYLFFRQSFYTSWTICNVIKNSGVCCRSVPPSLRPFDSPLTPIPTSGEVAFRLSSTTARPLVYHCMEYCHDLNSFKDTPRLKPAGQEQEMGFNDRPRQESQVRTL